MGLGAGRLLARLAHRRPRGRNANPAIPAIQALPPGYELAEQRTFPGLLDLQALVYEPNPPAAARLSEGAALRAQVR